MPLIEGKSDASRSKNIAELINAGHDPKESAAIAYSVQRKNSKDTQQPYDFTIDEPDAKSAREYDINGWAEIKGNPISKVGVFPYSGAQIGSPELEPDKIYMVYRPEAELSNPETIESFKLLPFTDDHAMLGSGDTGLMAAEKKGVHGVVGEDVYFEDGYLKANIKVFSEELANLINDGKKELSIGYRCLYDLQPGVYNNEKYDAIQREIRGNHLALVEEGRSGHDVKVLDSFKFTMDVKELIMADYDKPDLDMTGEMVDPNRERMDESMSLEECGRMLQELRDKVARLEGGENSVAGDEAEEEKKEDSEKAAKEGDSKRAKDKRANDEADPADFVKRADVTQDDDEDPDYKEAMRKEKEDVRDADMEKKDGEYCKPGSMDSQLKQLRAEVMDIRRTRTKAVFKEIAQRDALAAKLSQHIGTFDHSEKTLTEVALYGIQKLKLKAKAGHEESVLSGYLAGARTNNAVHANDSKIESGAVDSYLKGVR